jgi:N-acetylglutamate synthase/N-acetylornithine aminotransferase
MTAEQELLQEAIFADDANMRRLIKAIGGKISAATNGADIVKLRLVRAAVKAIGAARWGTGWMTS